MSIADTESFGIASPPSKRRGGAAVRSRDGFSFVYFIAMGNWTKIGKADDVQKRMANLQSATPVELHLMASIPTTQPLKLEAALHEHLKQYRLGGEWFDIPADVLRSTLAMLWRE